MANENELNPGVPEKKPEVDYKAELEKAQAEIERYKNAVTKANAEVSKVKKDLSDRMSAEEKAEAERKEQRARELQELEDLRKEKRISTYKAKLMESGYDAESALTMATALPEGVADTYFDAMKKHYENGIAQAQANALKNQPKPTPGGVLSPADASLERMLKGAGLK